jgi:hypothetical protein
MRQVVEDLPPFSRQRVRHCFERCARQESQDHEDQKDPPAPLGPILHTQEELKILKRA